MTLTVEEYNAVSHYTAHTKLDQSFDIHHDPETNEDFFIDYENNKEKHDIPWGLTLIGDAMAYPFEHDVSEEEAAILRNLFNRWKIRITIQRESMEKFTNDIAPSSSPCYNIHNTRQKGKKGGDRS